MINSMSQYPREAKCYRCPYPLANIIFYPSFPQMFMMFIASLFLKGEIYFQCVRCF